MDTIKTDPTTYVVGPIGRYPWRYRIRFVEQETDNGVSWEFFIERKRLTENTFGQKWKKKESGKIRTDDEDGFRIQT